MVYRFTLPAIPVQETLFSLNPVGGGSQTAGHQDRMGGKTEATGSALSTTLIAAGRSLQLLLVQSLPLPVLLAPLLPALF